MKNYIKKFGNMLISRPAGKEAYLAFSPTLNEIKDDELVDVDFEGVAVFSPSWGAEFLEPLRVRFGNRVSYQNTENPSVQATLKLLDEARSGG